MKVILDTNFLLIPYKFGVDIFSEIERVCVFNHELFIVDKTRYELDNIVKFQKGKDKDAAKLAISLLQSKNVGEVATSQDKIVDDLIVDLAEKEEIVVATNDKELIQRLKGKAKVLYLKSKKYLNLGG